MQRLSNEGSKNFINIFHCFHQEFGKDFQRFHKHFLMFFMVLGENLTAFPTTFLQVGYGYILYYIASLFSVVQHNS